MGGSPQRLTWAGWPQGIVICNVHIELADGRSVTPTRVLPYPSAAATGGEYRAGRGVRIRAVTVTAARAPAPLGSSCKYPVQASQSLDGTPSVFSDTKDLGVHVEVVSDPEPGSTQPMRLRLVVAIKSPRVRICRAFITLNPPNAEGFIRDETAKPVPVAITTSGTVTSEDVEVPANWGYSAIVYARLR